MYYPSSVLYFNACNEVERGQIIQEISALPESPDFPIGKLFLRTSEYYPAILDAFVFNEDKTPGLKKKNVKAANAYLLNAMKTIHACIGFSVVKYEINDKNKLSREDAVFSNAELAKIILEAKHKGFRGRSKIFISPVTNKMLEEKFIDAKYYQRSTWAQLIDLRKNKTM